MIFEKKKVIEHKKFFRFSPQRLSETFFILSRTEKDMTKNVYIHTCEGWNFNSGNYLFTTDTK